MWGRGTVLGGRYTLGERIGGGAMGEVWRAEDGVLERSVAVKILLPKLLEEAQFAARFRREAKVLASLSHPGIVDVHDYGEQSGAEEGDDRIAYIVMELVDGQPLDEVREDEGPMPVGRALGIVAEALDALHAAHRGGIVHRDLKPSNLMLRADGRVTVTDFGIAHSKAASRLTASHAVLGTALYIAPEQAEGIATVPASDLYSMGVVAYELLTGEPPFTGETVLEIVLKHIREPAPELPEAFPEAVRAFVARAMAKLPEERYADAAVMAAAARRAAGAAGVSGASGAGETSRPAAEPVVPVVPVVPVIPPVVPPAVPAGPGFGPAPAPATAPDPVPVPVPVLVSGPTTATVPAPVPWWKRQRMPVLVVVPVVLTAATVTVLNIGLTPDRTDKENGKAAGPAATSSADPGKQPLPKTPPSTPGTTPSAPATGSAASAEGANTGGKQAAVAGQNGGGAGASGGATGGKEAGAGGAGAGGGSGSGGAKDKPKPPPPPPSDGKPANCGGDGWGAITNVGTGRRMGLANASSTGTGGKVVAGGNTQFGWVLGGNQFTEFRACNLAGSALGLKQAPAYDEKTGTVLAETSGYSGYVTGWKTTPAAGGAHQINYYVGDGCVTDVGAGRQLAVEACTPGNKAQMWRLP
ncbi:serine/threonine-protein kinase [Streptomyces sp. NPDC021093]|uniref:serine/threonine-protein kinase n=1 Tax=Streptomyces sp. NPDC021093 TaxID=3365112 RepID=UPI0037BBA3B6